ncbi:TIGR02391 family protein [Burkholderia multivorans]|uniref:TIGR02391 family protein n=1 Tax=Burkholderia multivorans TaxID=87883 RepID=UPI000CFFB005|nr:TIGR02391 family protein [Burkholderia multivorans]MBU9263056.1 TIGR02391 family protein [Burkholderia multivorans]MBU9489900.1 TIGR02391 family protein [Burkholderia multivorans]MCO8612080.1 TIGR02391 family protein [Burkholderia multivorans]MCO8638449.1 TIGR02391 family protein [Burkholderia multivorans]MCO8646425.1 TIGR02391 family protein [Burkholderia multivorans]
MNLQTHIPAALWDAIRVAYEAENYSHAVLDATHFISNLLRERAGVDGDGSALIGQALGGENPKLRLNALQTESDRNVQKGYEQILRGIYIGIRNPRSHEPTQDTQETADSIICFLGHIVDVLSASKDVFTIASFMDKVQDPEFVESQRYAELLVAEIPALRLTEAITALFKERRALDLGKLRFLTRTLLDALSPTQTNNYLAIVSDELRIATEDAAIRTALRLLKPELWQNLQELPRLRIENKLIAGIKSGEVLQSGKTSAPLATWSNTFLCHFSLRKEAARALVSRLEDSNPNARLYVVKYFFLQLGEVLLEPALISRAVRAVANAVKNGEEPVRSRLINAVTALNPDWQKRFAEALESETDPDNPGVLLDDGSPFLSSPANEEDDIPF